MTVELVQQAPLRRTPKRGFAMGHKALALPSVILPARAKFGANRIRLASNADLSAYVDYIRDQNPTEQCVGMGLARNVHVAAQFAKFGCANPGAMPYPSSQGIYDLAREEEGTGPLVDEGSSPGLALQALLQDVGVPLERDWPIDPAKINTFLPVDVLAKSIAMKVTAAYAIDSQSTQRSDDCAQALLANHAFTIAIQVGDAYESCSSETPVTAIPANVQSFGGHDIPIVGFKTVNGRRQWLSPGSWGTGWGFGGWAWLDDSVITTASSADFLCVEVAPDFSLSGDHRALLAMNPKPLKGT